MQGLFHGLVTMAVVIPFLVLIYLPLFLMYASMIKASVNETYYEPTIDFTTPQIIGYSLIVFLLLFLIQLVTIVIVSHFYQVCKREDTGEPAEVGGYFIYLT